MRYEVVEVCAMPKRTCVGMSIEIQNLAACTAVFMLGMWGLAQQPLSLRVGYNDDDKSPARFVALSPSVLTCNQDTLCRRSRSATATQESQLYASMQVGRNGGAIARLRNVMLVQHKISCRKLNNESCHDFRRRRGGPLVQCLGCRARVAGRERQRQQKGRSYLQL